MQISNVLWGIFHDEQAPMKADLAPEVLTRPLVALPSFKFPHVILAENTKET
jgi:hypothetical protein